MTTNLPLGLFYHLFLLLSIASHTLAVSRNTCGDGHCLNYTLPMFEVCHGKMHHELGKPMETIPKLIPAPPFTSGCSGRLNTTAIPPGLRVCRFPDCLSNPCTNSWCEETMTGFVCHCRSKSKGWNCQTLVNDHPVLTNCPKNINQSVELGDLGSTVDWIPPKVTTMSHKAPTVVANIQPGSFFNMTNETVKVTYRVSDDSGWMDDSCAFNITFYSVDTTPPVINRCPSNKTIYVKLGIHSWFEQWEEPTASDAAGIASITSNYQSNAVIHLNTHINVKYTVTDNSGLTNTNCAFTIQVEAFEPDWKCTLYKCYHTDEFLRSWVEAKFFCDTHGLVETEFGEKQSSLLFVDNGSELEQIKGLYRSYHYNSTAWINCNGAFNNDLKCDIVGRGALHYDTPNWDDDEPNRDYFKDCVAVEEQTGKWKSASCHDQYTTICQLVLGETG